MLQQYRKIKKKGGKKTIKRQKRTKKTHKTYKTLKKTQKYYKNKKKSTKPILPKIQKKRKNSKNIKKNIQVLRTINSSRCQKDEPQLKLSEAQVKLILMGKNLLYGSKH